MVTQAGIFASVKAVTPAPIRRLSRQLKQWTLDRRNQRVTASDVFTQVYDQQMWGKGEETRFFSGLGSGPEAAHPYASFVRAFMARYSARTVVDLGCGDFRVGSLIAIDCDRYIGIDVVEALIRDNSSRHGSEKIEFKALDITTDTLPPADLCLIREVLQHLSNAQIRAVLSRVRQYPYVLITDIQPDDAARYRVNKDKVHGPSSRIMHGSVLRLDQPPFSVPDVVQVFESEAPRMGDEIYGKSFKLRTFLIRH